MQISFAQINFSLGFNTPFLLMSPNISNTEGISSHVSQQQDTLHVAAMSLYEPLKHLSQNVHTSHSITRKITAELSKSCHVF